MHVHVRCTRRLLNTTYTGDPEPKKTLRLLRRFQATCHLPGFPPSFLLFKEPFEGNFVEIQLDEEGVMVENDIIGIFLMRW